MKLSVKEITGDMPNDVRCMRICFGSRGNTTRQKAIKAYWQQLGRFTTYRKACRYANSNIPINALYRHMVAAGIKSRLDVAMVRPKYLTGTLTMIGVDVFSEYFEGKYINGTYQTTR